jgi:hypothetical protein
MEGIRQKVMSEMLILGARFCEEAADLIEAHKRRKEILRRGPVKREDVEGEMRRGWTNRGRTECED